MNYSLDAGAWSSVFAVPSSVVDKYIKLADGTSLKLLLFLLRHGGESFDEAKLRDALGIKRDGELEDAAMFWFQRGIIRMDEGELIPTEEAAQEHLPEVAAESLEQKPSSLRRVADSSAGAAIYTSRDIAQRINTDSAVDFLFREVQALYGRTLKTTESRMVLQLTDFYGLPAEVAVMLLKYCFRIGKTTPNYILAVAQDWVNENIRTVAEADAHLLKLEKRFTVDKTGSLNFSYTNKILENWKTSGIYNTDDAKCESEERRGKLAKKSGGSSSIDMDDVMDELRRQYQ